MECPGCGYANPPGMKFCGACGRAFKKTCASCGFENVFQFKFCGECGVPLDSQGEAHRPGPADQQLPASSGSPPIEGPSSPPLEERRHILLTGQVQMDSLLRMRMSQTLRPEITTYLFRM